MHDVRHPAQNVISWCLGLVLQCVLLCTAYLGTANVRVVVTAQRNTKTGGDGGQEPSVTTSTIIAA